MALQGLLPPGAKVLTTGMEHNAVARPLRWLEKEHGLQLEIVPCNAEGMLDIAAMAAAIATTKPYAVVMTHASNVSGAVLPVAEVGRLTRKAKVLLIVDAAQTAGIEAIDVEAMGIDVLAFSGHKGLLGPQGTGGLYVRTGLQPKPLRFGGTGSLSESDQQPEFFPDRLESGTPNTPGIAGLQAGLHYIQERGRENIRQAELQHTRHLLAGLGNIPGLKLIGSPNCENRTAVVSCVVAGWDTGELAYELDQQFGIACRAGLHCAPWAHQTLGTMKTGTIRFSPGPFTTTTEIEIVIKAMGILAGKTGEA